MLVLCHNESAEICNPFRLLAALPLLLGAHPIQIPATHPVVAHRAAEHWETHQITPSQDSYKAAEHVSPLPTPVSTPIPTPTPQSEPTQASQPSGSALLDAIARCESTMNPRATNGTHFGLFQFDLSTWASVGGTGNPMDASPAEQYARAQTLLNVRGTQPWLASKSCWGK